jgi:6-phosphogluconolactonase (cycloisomerase 2 family)
MSKYFMISRLTRSALHMTSRALGLTRLAGLLGLMTLLTACGGGGGSSGGGGGGGGGGNNPPAVTLSSISVTPASASVVAGLTLQFVATGNYSDGTTKDLTSTVTWTSSDTSIATIAATSGLATGAKAGSATVTATYTNSSTGTVAGSDGLTVKGPNLVKVDLSPNKPNVPVRQVFKFRATGTYTDNSTADVTGQVTNWGTSNPAIATIGTDGTVTTANLGTTDISASIPNGPTITGVTVTVTADVYAYATNFTSNTVSQYQVSTTDGSLTPLATPTVATGQNPFSVSVEPSGEYVYVSNWSASSISQFRIGADGSLTALAGRDVPTGMSPNAVTLDHNNRWAYVANLGENTVSQYSIGLDGQLSPMSTAKVQAGANPATIVIDPTNKFAYVGNFGANARVPPAGPSTISQFSVGSNGALTPLSASTVATGSGPSAIAIDPASKYVYVANLGDNNVGQYTIGGDGTLTAMTSPTVPSGNSPAGITIALASNGSASYVYVANQGSNTISVYSISTTDGSLTAVGAPVTAGTGVSSVSVDPAIPSRYVYATNRGSMTVSQYSIGVGGALTPIASSATAPAGMEPTAIATGY